MDEKENINRKDDNIIMNELKIYATPDLSMGDHSIYYLTLVAKDDDEAFQSFKEYLDNHETDVNHYRIELIKEDIFCYDIGKILKFDSDEL